MYGTKEDPVNLNDTTTPKRPIVNVPAQGESMTGFDLHSSVTVSGLNVSESDRSKPTSMMRFRPGITSRQKPPKPGSRMTTKQATKGGKTTPPRLVSPTAKVTPSTNLAQIKTLAPKVNTTLREQGHQTSMVSGGAKTSQSVSKDVTTTSVPLAGTTIEDVSTGFEMICIGHLTILCCFGFNLFSLLGVSFTKLVL